MEIGKWKPEMALVAMEISYAGMNILMKVVLGRGMNHFVFVTYRQIIAVLAIAPLAYIKEKSVRPPMTVVIFVQIFFLALLGVAFTQNFFLAGLYYTGSTFSSAMSNLIPAFTFMLAAILGIERVLIKTWRGTAKVAGTVGCVGGAMVMTFYEGPGIIFFKFSSESRYLTFLGSSLLIAYVLSTSTRLILQTYVVRRYPAHLSVVAIMMIIGALQSGVVALCLEGSRAEIWSIGWDMNLFTCFYAGILCSAAAYFIQSWCVEKRGPVFVAVFNPLATICAAIMECILLHYTLHVGSVLGGAIIIMGLYLVLWGKAKSQGDVNDAQKVVIKNEDEEGGTQKVVINNGDEEGGSLYYANNNSTTQPLLSDNSNQNQI